MSATAGCGLDVGARRAPALAVLERDQPAGLEAPQRREVAPVARSGSASSSARWLSVSRSPSSGASVRNAHGSVRGFPRGGSTSWRARAGVEQYSSAIHSASSTRSSGTSSSRTPVGATSRSGASSECSASPTTTPSSAWRPNGTRTIEPTRTGCSGSA